jgi:hypothetical protein
VGTRTKQIVWLVLLVLVVNLPLAQSTLTRLRVERSGTVVTATVIDSEVRGDPDDPSYWIAYRLPGPDRRPLAREVDKSAYDAAVESGRVTVRVLDDDPVTAMVEGQVVSRAGLVATLVADLLILGFLWVLWRYGRYGRYGRPDVLRLEAVEDLTPGAGEPAIQDAEDLVVVTGRIAEVTDEDVVIEADGRRVVVVLDGHAVLVDEGETGRVRGRRLG